MFLLIKLMMGLSHKEKWKYLIDLITVYQEIH